MGLAALLVGVIIAAVIGMAILYGIVLGVARFGRFLWQSMLGPPVQAIEGTGTAQSSCWRDKDCPPSVRESCPAYAHQKDGLPCWLTNMRAEGRLRVNCLTCKRFDMAALAGLVSG